MFKINLIQRMISLFLVVTFLVTNSTVLPVFASDNISLPVNLKSLPNHLPSLKLPEDLGSIQDSYQGNTQEKVILIQDAHAVPEAQLKIQQTINYFQKEYGIKRVALEGVWTHLDPQIFKSFPDKVLLKEVLDPYYEKGEISGPTLAAIFNEQEAHYQGIEDRLLYHQGLRYYLEASSESQKRLEKLTKQQQLLETQKKETYSEDLWKVDQALQDFEEDAMGLAQALKVIAEIQAPESESQIERLLAEDEDLKKHRR